MADNDTYEEIVYEGLPPHPVIYVYVDGILMEKIDAI